MRIANISIFKGKISFPVIIGLEKEYMGYEMGRKNSYDDIQELLNDIRSDIEDTLSDEVLDKVKDIELKHVEEDVFAVYKPKIYERRENGGIDDPDNIVGDVHDMQLEVENVTRFNDGYFSSNHGVGLADLINDGDRFGGYFYDYPGSFNQPRPFLDNTVEEIEKTDSVENALAEGLRKRKYDIS